MGRGFFVTLRDSLDLAENTIHIRRQQLLNTQTFFERFTFLNFNLNWICRWNSSSTRTSWTCFRCAAHREECGQYYQPVARDHRLAFFYRGLDGVLRRTLIEMEPRPSHLDQRSARWELRLMPLKQVQIDVTVTPLVDGGNRRGATRDFPACLRDRKPRDEWSATMARTRTDW